MLIGAVNKAIDEGKKNIDLVVRHGIFTENEFRARYAIHLDAYQKIISIEAKTMIDMALHQILPAASAYTGELCRTAAAKKEMGASCSSETRLIARLSEAQDGLYERVEQMKRELAAIPGEPEDAARYCRNVIFASMETIRGYADTLEELTAKKYWPYPTYSDLMFY